MKRYYIHASCTLSTNRFISADPASTRDALKQLDTLRYTYRLNDVYGYYASEAEARASEHGAYLDGHVHARRELSKDGSLVSLYAEGYDLYAEEIEGDAPIDDPAAWEDADITPIVVAEWGYEPILA
jgi:hypothetical protein